MWSWLSKKNLPGTVNSLYYIFWEVCGLGDQDGCLILYQDILRQQIKVDDISAEARLAHSFDQHILAKRFRDLQN